MTAQHFHCTQCGKCCYGLIPLTLADAFAHIDCFPLAMVWTPVRPSSRTYDLTATLGTTTSVLGKKQTAVLLSPAAYIPPSMACPLLSSDNLCMIHEQKPQRCKTMPFFAYWEEEDQATLLVPRKGWACDVTAQAPLVYQNKKIVNRAEFDCERQLLLVEAKTLKDYADQKLAQAGPQRLGLAQAAKLSVAGMHIENFSSFIRYDRRMDMVAFAKRQHPVLTDFAQKTAGVAEYKTHHNYYKKTAEELEWFVKQAQNAS